jgi:hypothetical protein
MHIGKRVGLPSDMQLEELVGGLKQRKGVRPGYVAGVLLWSVAHGALWLLQGNCYCASATASAHYLHKGLDSPPSRMQLLPRERAGIESSVVPQWCGGERPD